MPGFIGSERPYLDGDREMSLRLIAIFAYDMDRGHCFHFQSTDGQRLIWFSRRKQALQIGDGIRARFVVYRHQTYEGIEENLIRKLRIVSKVYNAAHGPQDHPAEH